MNLAPLDAVPLWLLFVGAAGLCLAAVEAGYRFGQWRRRRVTQEKEAPVGAMVGAMLGLLAFLLAFTFSLAASRFDERRRTVLDEANAIGTTYLRTRLLPEPHKTQIAKLLRDYVDARVEAVETGQVKEGIHRSEELQERLWSEAVAAADKNSASVMTALFLHSLNETIDIHSKRLLVGTRSRIPLVIWIGLLALALLSMGGIGYQSGLSETRRSPIMVALVVAFAGVLFLIADLDRGREGLLQVDQKAMHDLQKSMRPD